MKGCDRTPLGQRDDLSGLLQVRRALRALQLVDLLALAKVRVVQFLRRHGMMSVLLVPPWSRCRRTMFARRFAVETAFSFSSTFSSGRSISVSFVPVVSPKSVVPMGTTKGRVENRKGKICPEGTNGIERRKKTENRPTHQCAPRPSTPAPHPAP